MSIWISTIVSVLVVSLISLIGLATLVWSKLFTKKMIMVLVGLSAGALIGDALLHLMPEAVEDAGSSLGPWYGLIGGFVLFFVIEKVIHWRHCHHETTSNHPHPVGTMNLIGDSLHNFMDGAVIAGSFIASPAIGLTTTIAVISHEIPQEMGDFGVLLHAGYSRSKALLLNFVTALTAVLGAVITLLVHGNVADINGFIIPITAGGFLYIAASDLIPEMKQHEQDSKGLMQFITFILGLLIMLAFKLLVE